MSEWPGRLRRMSGCIAPRIPGAALALRAAALRSHLQCLESSRPVFTEALEWFATGVFENEPQGYRGLAQKIVVHTIGRVGELHSPIRRSGRRAPPAQISDAGVEFVRIPPQLAHIGGDLACVVVRLDRIAL